jgi:hypothetical protein
MSTNDIESNPTEVLKSNDHHPIAINSSLLATITNFAEMNKKDLINFRIDARRARELPCLADNYFTPNRNREVMQQPDDWVLT